MHAAECGRAVDDQAGVHLELAIARHELTRAVQRIDQPERLVEIQRRLGPLLGNHRYAGREALQSLDHDAVGGEVGGGDRRGIVLRRHLEGSGVDFHDGAAGRFAQQAHLMF